MITIAALLTVHAAGARADFRVYRAMQRAEQLRKLQQTQNGQNVVKQIGPKRDLSDTNTARINQGDNATMSATSSSEVASTKGTTASAQSNGK